MKFPSICLAAAALLALPGCAPQVNDSEKAADAIGKRVDDLEERLTFLETKDPEVAFVRQVHLIREKFPAAQSTSTGLHYIVTRKGEGAKPERGNQCVAHYDGRLLDGAKFDSSYDRGQPFAFAVGKGQVIKGWDEAFLDMQVGEKRQLILPSTLGYGSRGSGKIPANAILVFDVELVNFGK